jgi:uncharacterized membrane protein
MIASDATPSDTLDTSGQWVRHDTMGQSSDRHEAFVSQRGGKDVVGKGAPRVSGVRSQLWFIPVMCVLGGVVLSLGTLTIDRLAGFDLIPRWMTGGPDAAMGILTTIALSMVSLATLVLTITMVVVQLAMGQFSPRIVQTFLRDRPSQLAIGLFVATFTHAMLSMREVQFDGDGQVPGIAIGVAYVLVLVSIAMLVLYVDHIGRSLRVSSLIELVGDDTRRLLDVEFGEMLPVAEPLPSTILASTSGVLTSIDRDELVELAASADCVLHVVPAVGSFVPAGATLLTVEGNVERLDRDAAIDCVELGLERTLDEDVAYGFRMLVDVAERSLSESPFLDPTTAVQAIDRLHDGLRQLAMRVIPDGRHHDQTGRLRLTVPAMAWDAYVHLAFDEIRLVGAASPQVSRRLVAALTDLIDYAPPDRRPVLVEQLDLLQAAICELPRDRRDRHRSAIADGQGLGTAGTNERVR